MKGKKLITFLVLFLLSFPGPIFSQGQEHLVTWQAPIYPQDYRLGPLSPLDNGADPVMKAGETLITFYQELLQEMPSLSGSGAGDEKGDTGKWTSFFTPGALYMHLQMKKIVHDDRNIYPRQVRIGRGEETPGDGEEAMVMLPVKLSASYRGKLFIREGTVLFLDKKILSADFPLFSPFPEEESRAIQYEPDTTDRSYHGQYTR